MNITYIYTSIYTSTVVSQFYQSAERMPVSSVDMVQSPVDSLGTEAELETFGRTEMAVLQQCMVVGMADSQ